MNTNIKANMNTNMRRLIVAGVATVLLAFLGWAIVSHRSSGTAATPADSMASTGSMPGMSTTQNGSVQLTASQIHQFGVTFDTAAIRRLTSDTRTAGVVTFDETNMAQVAPKFGGFVERLFINSTGQQVRRGQAMLTIYSPELLAAQQELLLAAKLDRSIGRSSVPGVPGESANLADASRRRLQLWDISNAQIDDILRTGQVRRTLTLYAPVSGIVVDKKVLQGQAITAGQELYTIADLSYVWVDAELREADAANVRVGSAVGIRFPGLPGRPYRGRVAYVYPTLQQEARTVKARIVIPNADGVLKPGMYGTVQLTTPSRSALTVPSSAILRTGDRNIVFVDMGNGQLMPHNVEPGSTAGNYTEILSGLEPGQRVVTSAQFLLDSESNLGEVMKSMIGNMGSGDKASGSMAGMKMGGDSAATAPTAPANNQTNPGMNDKGADVKTMQNMKNMPGMQASPQMPAPATKPSSSPAAKSVAKPRR